MTDQLDRIEAMLTELLKRREGNVDKLISGVKKKLDGRDPIPAIEERHWRKILKRLEQVNKLRKKVI